MQNLPMSGVSKATPLKPNDENWDKNGIVQKFDQQEFIQEKEWAQSGLGKWGYIYYPKSCTNSNSKCSAQFVLNGCSDKPLDLCQNEIPIASNNNLVLVFPHVKTCWRTADTRLAEYE